MSVTKFLDYLFAHTATAELAIQFSEVCAYRTAACSLPASSGARATAA
jgi:hypothetical protein